MWPIILILTGKFYLLNNHVGIGINFFGEGLLSVFSFIQETRGVLGAIIMNQCHSDCPRVCWWTDNLFRIMRNWYSLHDSTKIHFWSLVL